MLLLLLGLWFGTCLLVVALCVAAKRGDRVVVTVPRSVEGPDWVATVMEPAPTVSLPNVAAPISSPS